MRGPNIHDIEVIAPNFKRRLSGVTATVVRLVPIQAKDINIVTTGAGLPDELPHIPIYKLFTLPRNQPRVWHARRNIEMLFGLILKHVFRRKLVLLFTSASQRHHKPYTKWLISKMAGVIATSKKTKHYLTCPATVVMHGINTDQFSPTHDKSELRHSLGLPNGFLIGCYGRIRAQKGTDAFVNAMIELLPRHQDAIALVMGRATASHQDFLDGLIKRVRDANLEKRILFLPEVSVDKMADWYRVLDLYIAPQRWEGFGLTPLEAMSCGVPVVATRVGAFEELIDATVGSLVDIGDGQELATASEPYLQDNHYAQMQGKNARQIACSRFTIEGEAQALNEIYRDLLSR